VTPSERALLTSLKPQDTARDPLNPHPSLANHLAMSDHPVSHQPMNDPALAEPHLSLASHLVVSDHCLYPAPVSHRPMDDPDLTESHPSLASHLVESDDYCYATNLGCRQTVDSSGLANSHCSLANYLEESNDCCYATDQYLQQTMSASGALNTSLSYSSWIDPNANTASDPEPQAMVNSCDGIQASVSSSYAMDYPYNPSGISTEVSNDFGSAHTDGVSVVKDPEVLRTFPDFILSSETQQLTTPISTTI